MIMRRVVSSRSVSSISKSWQSAKLDSAGRQKQFTQVEKFDSLISRINVNKVSLFGQFLSSFRSKNIFFKSQKQPLYLFFESIIKGHSLTVAKEQSKDRNSSIFFRETPMVPSPSLSQRENVLEARVSLLDPMLQKYFEQTFRLCWSSKIFIGGSALRDYSWQRISLGSVSSINLKRNYLYRIGFWSN